MVSIFYGNSLVNEIVFEVDGTRTADVENGGDAELRQEIEVARISGRSDEEMREDLGRRAGR